VRPCLTFILPAELEALAQYGRHSPAHWGCELTVGRGGVVTIKGPSRHAVFEQAIRFLRVLMRETGRPAAPVAIAAVYTSFEGPRDAWQIVIGADIAFVPTGMEPVLSSAAG
jgi:hypothetical protein